MRTHLIVGWWVLVAAICVLMFTLSGRAAGRKWTVVPFIGNWGCVYVLESTLTGEAIGITSYETQSAFRPCAEVR